MTARLKAYIRRTVLASARDYAGGKRRTAESTVSAFRDAANGTDTGWWNDLIYTADVLDMFNRYRGDVRAAVLDYLSEVGGGEGVGAFADRDRTYTFADIIAATARRQTWEQYRGDNGDARAKEAEAAAFGIRFAVEYLLSDVASMMGVDL
jgi:hypothetical protein